MKFIPTFVTQNREGTMIKSVIDANSIAELKSILASVNRIVVTCHKKADGDAIGSSLAMCRLLNNMGKNAVVIIPDQLPASLEFIAPSNEYVTFTMCETRASNIIRNTQLILSLDYNSFDRVDNMQPLLEASKAKKVLIDHHRDPKDCFDVMISHPFMSSTCELVFRLAAEAGWLQWIDKDVASYLFVGIMTDTGNLSFSSSYPDVYEVMARLMEYGIDKPYLYKQAMDTVSLNSLRLQSYAILNKMTLIDDSMALITLDKDDLKQFNYHTGDTERLVNKPLSVDGVFWSTFMREDSKYIKVSMRSEGDFFVNTICAKYFNGGGHKNAAAGEFYGTMQEAVELFHKIVEQIKNDINIEYEN